MLREGHGGLEQSPNNGKKKKVKGERLRGEGHQIKSIDLRIER